MSTQRRDLFIWLAVMLILITGFRGWAARNTTAPDACVDVTPDILHDGYCLDSYEVPALITYATYWQTPPLYTVGRALYYAEGLMEYVAEQKGYDTSGVDGLVSLLSPSTVGWTFSIRVPTFPGWLTVMDVDAAALEHYYSHIMFSRSPIEFSYALAEQTGLIDWIDPVTKDRFFNVEICLSLEPERDCDGEPIDYRAWFLSILRYQQ